MKNRAFWRALHLLTSPAALAAVTILLINDHLLRRVWPSWWTGKIGDFAWLYFAPFVAAAILAWLIPPKWKNQEKLVGLLSFGLVGGTFALANTSPEFHRWFSEGLESLLRIPFVIHRDPTDLMATISLWFGWRAWRLSELPQRSFSTAGWVSFLAAAFLTLANGMPAPDYQNLGIDCLRIENEVLLAHATPIHFYARHDTNFASTDGGLTWTEVDDDPDFECATFDGELVVDPTNEQIHYRVIADTKIEQSTDGGNTWPEVFSLEPLGEAEATFYRRTRIDPVEISPVPLDAIIDPASGNTLFAMGHRGVLVHTASGAWEWVGVGPHVRMDADYSDSIPRMLVVEIILALSFAVLGFLTLSQRTLWNKPILVVTAVIWAMWLFSTINFAPNSLVRNARYDIAEILCSGLVLVTFGVAALFAIANVVALFKEQRGSVVRIAVVALVGAALYFLPYLLWMLNILPRYSDALIIAIVTGAVTLIAGDLWHRAYLRSLPTGDVQTADPGGSDVQ
jgi:hypothetical protein